MSLIRYRIDLAIPEPIPPALAGQLNAIEQHIRVLKSFAVKINDGMVDEEATIKATKHICHHDEIGNSTCEPEQEI